MSLFVAGIETVTQLVLHLGLPILAPSSFRILDSPIPAETPRRCVENPTYLDAPRKPAKLMGTTSAGRSGKRKTSTERTKSRKGQAGLTELREAFVFNQGETDMGDKGSKDKGKREQQKKAQRSPKEKRKLKREKKNK